MSILTVAQYQEMTGDTTTFESDIQQALYIYTAVIEAYCNRTFGPTAYSEVYRSVQTDPLILNHSQVKEITSLTAGTISETVADLDVHFNNGFIWHAGAWIDSDVTIVYIAGDEAPYDVKHVLATLATGYLAGTTGGANALQTVVKETVYGVSSVQYDNSQTSAEAGGNAELGAFTTLLDRYVEPVLA